MSINTVLFDLDGTLVHFSQQEFIGSYFSKLGKVFERLGMDAERSVKAVWTGTKAMLLNDGGRLNAERFWTAFADEMKLAGDKLKAIEAACDDFYENEFDAVQSVMIRQDISERLVRAMAAKGYGLVLATNPLFPACGVVTRLKWIGLVPEDFQLITHYSNSTFCKPNPGYYQEVFAKIGRPPEQCIMIGNSLTEDMCAGALGAETFLVTDCLENEKGADITPFRHGTFAELEKYLLSMPDIG
jgi:FMN phosphatase YigB (HAD superfamily)